MKIGETRIVGKQTRTTAIFSTASAALISLDLYSDLQIDLKVGEVPSNTTLLCLTELLPPFISQTLRDGTPQVQIQIDYLTSHCKAACKKEVNSWSYFSIPP